MLEFLGKSFDVADLRRAAFPTSVGGNTQGTCPLQEFTRDYYGRHQHPPSARETVEHLVSVKPRVQQCWHHRRTAAQQRYIADLSCWFVEHGLQPYEEAIEAVVTRDGEQRELWQDVYTLFTDPIRWNYRGCRGETQPRAGRTRESPGKS